MTVWNSIAFLNAARGLHIWKNGEHTVTFSHSCVLRPQQKHNTSNGVWIKPEPFQKPLHLCWAHRKRQQDRRDKRQREMENYRTFLMEKQNKKAKHNRALWTEAEKVFSPSWWLGREIWILQQNIWLMTLLYMPGHGSLGNLVHEVHVRLNKLINAWDGNLQGCLQ